MKKLILFLVLTIPVLGFAQSPAISEAELISFMTMNTSEMVSANRILQLGSYNHTEIYGTNLNLNQTGENQHFYYRESTLTPSNIQVEMEGKDNYIEILGNNSILENMSIKLNGDYRSVIIRNYQ